MKTNYLKMIFALLVVAFLTASCNTYCLSGQSVADK